MHRVYVNEDIALFCFFCFVLCVGGACVCVCVGGACVCVGIAVGLRQISRNKERLNEAINPLPSIYFIE